MNTTEWVNYIVTGNVEMREYLEFAETLKDPELLKFLQNYLSMLVRQSTERSQEDMDDTVTLNARMVIGQKVYHSEDADEFISAISKELPKADGFVVDLTCCGNLREANDTLEEDDLERMIQVGSVWTGSGMYDMLDSCKQKEHFTYKLAAYYPNSGEAEYKKLQDGKRVDLFESFSPAIIDKEVTQEWWSFDLSLCADFDFNKYADRLNALQQVVRESIPQSEVGYCESVWDDGEPQVLCNGIQWITSDLNEVQSFLDKLNAILLPIKDEVDASGSGTWEIKDEFALATWTWTEEGFKVVGTLY